jgi:hypothetical protein
VAGIVGQLRPECILPDLAAISGLKQFSKVFALLG